MKKTYKKIAEEAFKTMSEEDVFVPEEKENADTFMPIKGKQLKIDKINKKICGNGTSIWGPSKCDCMVRKLYLVTAPEINPHPIELRAFGDNTQWHHYTDRQIQKEMNSRILPIIQKRIKKPIKKLSWSEQGMQPKNGWSFDILYYKE